jgi:hypothetical protein
MLEPNVFDYLIGVVGVCGLWILFLDLCDNCWIILLWTYEGVLACFD